MNSFFIIYFCRFSLQMKMYLLFIAFCFAFIPHKRFICRKMQEVHRTFIPLLQNQSQQIMKLLTKFTTKNTESKRKEKNCDTYTQNLFSDYNYFYTGSFLSFVQTISFRAKVWSQIFNCGLFFYDWKCCGCREIFIRPWKYVSF